MSVLIAEVAGPILDCEIDDRLSQSNQYFQQTGFVLDDLHVYAESFATFDRTIMNEAEGFIRPLTEKQVWAMYQKAIKNIRALHAAMSEETEQR